MSRVYTDPQHYTDIANAIRYKNGTATQYKPQNMAAAIRAIETEPTIQTLSVTANGTYTAPTGVDGYSPVTVNVPSTGGYDYGVNVEEPSIAVEQNLDNWSWNAASGVSFPNAYSNGINTVTGYVGGSGYERMRNTISGLSQYAWYIFSFKFCSPSGFVDGNYGDPFACAINSTSQYNPSGTRALNEYYSYINGMTRRFNRQASTQMEEYHIIFNTKNNTQANISIEFGSITDGVAADFIFSNFSLSKISEIKKNI